VYRSYLSNFLIVFCYVTFNVTQYCFIVFVVFFLSFFLPFEVVFYLYVSLTSVVDFNFQSLMA